MPHATVNTTAQPGLPADRIFALVGGAVLMLAGLLILARVCTAIRAPTHLYEATAIFQLSLADGAPDGDGAQAAWRLLPADAAVGLEPDSRDPHAYRLSFRSPDPARIVAQTNSIVAGMQESAKRPGMGHFQVIHPADHAVERPGSRSHQLPGSVLLLLLALAPVYFGARLAFRHRAVTHANAAPTP